MRGAMPHFGRQGGAADAALIGDDEAVEVTFPVLSSTNISGSKVVDASGVFR